MPSAPPDTRCMLSTACPCDLPATQTVTVANGHLTAHVCDEHAALAYHVEELRKGHHRAKGDR